MQVRIDDNVDIPGFELQFPELAGERPGVIDPVNLCVFRIELIADSRFHQDVVTARPDQQASQADADAIARVSRDPLLPHRLGNN